MIEQILGQILGFFCIGIFVLPFVGVFVWIFGWVGWSFLRWINDSLTMWAIGVPRMLSVFFQYWITQWKHPIFWVSQIVFSLGPALVDHSYWKPAGMSVFGGITLLIPLVFLVWDIKNIRGARVRVRLSRTHEGATACMCCNQQWELHTFFVPMSPLPGSNLSVPRRLDLCRKCQQEAFQFLVERLGGAEGRILCDQFQRFNT